ALFFNLLVSLYVVSFVKCLLLLVVPLSIFLLLMRRPHHTSTLFPYTTLFRSQRAKEETQCLPKKKTAQRIRRAQPHRGAHWQCRSEEHTSELQSRFDLVCRLLLEKKNTQ